MNYIKALAISALAVLAPIKTVLIAAMILSMVDLVLGIMAARKRGEKITSKGFGHTIIKILTYELAIICGFIVQKFLIQDSMPIVSLIGGLIGVTELKSVLENLDCISGNSLYQSIIDLLNSKSNKNPPK